MLRLTVAISLVCVCLALPAPQAPAPAAVVPAAPAIIPANIIRTNNPDGSEGFSFQSTDGVQRDESRGADGSVRGRYSYVDPSGRTITVNYIADRLGFRATGDHLPGGASAGPAPVAPAVAVAPAPAPAPAVVPASTVALAQAPQVIATRQFVPWLSQPSVVGVPASTARLGQPIIVQSSPYWGHPLLFG